MQIGASFNFTVVSLISSAFTLLCSLKQFRLRNKSFFSFRYPFVKERVEKCKLERPLISRLFLLSATLLRGTCQLIKTSDIFHMRSIHGDH